MKKVIFLCILVICLLTGCGKSPTIDDVYNEQDVRDFKDLTSAVTFEIVNFNNVLDAKVLREAGIEGSSFIFFGSASGSVNEKEVLQNYYYGYVKNKHGGMYFAQVPADKVRIYEDAPEGKAFLVASTHIAEIEPRYENRWDKYAYFNLHVSKGTLLQKANVDILTSVQ